jgi:hypothetical protein
VSIPWPPIAPPDPGTALGADLVHLTLALPTVRDVWDKARWDSATWDAFDYNDFRDASCDCAGVSIERGRGDPLGHANPAKASFQLDNPTGVYSPWNTVDVNGGDLGAPVFGPDIPVRVATATGPLFTGFVRTVEETDSGGESHVQVTATDALSFLGDANGYEQASQGGGEKAGARLARIITAAAVPAHVDRALATGSVALQATTLAKGALEEAWLTADSDAGVFYATKAGALRYVDPAGLEAPEFTEVQASFSDTGEDLCPIQFTVKASRDTVKNTVSVSAAGGTAQTVTDPASIARHGVRSTQRFDLIHQGGDSWSLAVARSMLDRLAGADLAISPIDMVPTDDDDAYAAAPALDLGSRIELTRYRFGQVLHQLATVDGISHSINLDQWTMTLRCSPGPQVAGWTHWDAATWDAAYWDRRPY